MNKIKVVSAHRKALEGSWIFTGSAYHSRLLAYRHSVNAKKEERQADRQAFPL